MASTTDASNYWFCKKCERDQWKCICGLKSPKAEGDEIPDEDDIASALGFADDLEDEEEEECDAVDALHDVVEEVTGERPPAKPKTKRLSTIGFIQ